MKSTQRERKSTQRKKYSAQCKCSGGIVPLPLAESSPPLNRKYERSAHPHKATDNHAYLTNRLDVILHCAANS